MDMPPDGCLAYKTFSLCLLFPVVDKRWDMCEWKIKKCMLEPVFFQPETMPDARLLLSEVEAILKINIWSFQYNNNIIDP